MSKKRIKDRLKRYILIITAVLLLTQIIRIYNFWVKLVNEEEFRFSVFVSDGNEKCQFKLNNWPFLVENCYKYQTGSEIRLIGRLTTTSDSQLLKTKKLNVRVISVNKNLLSSVLGWIEVVVAVVRIVRGEVVTMLMGYMPSTPLALVIDMPFGQIIDLPEQVYQQLKTIGMLHVVAASGYNVSLVAGLVGSFAARFRRSQSLLIWVVGMTLYLFLSDFSISILRAFFMFILKAFAEGMGRVYHNLILLTTAVFVFLLFKPWLILNLSFQLSVGATMGLILFAGIFTKWIKQFAKFLHLRHHFFDQYLVEPLATAIAAQIITTPILLWHFGEVTVFSFIANLILLWMTPLLTTGGFLLFFLGALALSMPLFTKLVAFFSLYIWFYASFFVNLAGYLSQTFLFKIKFQSSSFLFFSSLFFITILIFYKKRLNEKKNHFLLN